MKTVAVDTSVLVDAFHGDESFRRTLAGAERILVSPVVYAEYMAGFDDSRKGRAAKDLFRSFLSLDHVEMPPLGEETADIHVRLFRHLREQGMPIPQNDLWIASSALEHGAVLLTADAHFDAIPTLRTERPAPKRDRKP